MTKHELDEINSMRETYHMRPIIPAKRKCLRCDEVFNSRGIHNRICPVCKEDADYGIWMEEYHLPQHVNDQISTLLDKYMVQHYPSLEALLDTSLLDKEEI